MVKSRKKVNMSRKTGLNNRSIFTVFAVLGLALPITIILLLLITSLLTESGGDFGYRGVALTTTVGLWLIIRALIYVVGLTQFYIGKQYHSEHQKRVLYKKYTSALLITDVMAVVAYLSILLYIVIIR